MTRKWLGAVAVLPAALFLISGCVSGPKGAGTITDGPLVAATSMKLTKLSVRGMT